MVAVVVMGGEGVGGDVGVFGGVVALLLTKGLQDYFSPCARALTRYHTALIGGINVVSVNDRGRELIRQTSKTVERKQSPCLRTS